MSAHSFPGGTRWYRSDRSVPVAEQTHQETRSSVLGRRHSEAIHRHQLRSLPHFNHHVLIALDPGHNPVKINGGNPHVAWAYLGLRSRCSRRLRWLGGRCRRGDHRRKRDSSNGGHETSSDPGPVSKLKPSARSIPRHDLQRLPSLQGADYRVVGARSRPQVSIFSATGAGVAVGADVMVGAGVSVGGGVSVGTGSVGAGVSVDATALVAVGGSVGVGASSDTGVIADSVVQTGTDVAA